MYNFLAEIFIYVAVVLYSHYTALILVIKLFLLPVALSIIL